MTQPKIPPEIARKIAEMNKAAPPAKPAPKPTPPAAARAAPAPPREPAQPGSLAAKLAAVGWLIAALAVAAAVGEYYWFASDKQNALAAQAADYEAKLQQARAEADTTLRKIQDSAEASQQILKAELDFEKQPPLPLKLVFRKGGVLYVENELGDSFSSRVWLTRAGKTREFTLTINPRAFRDLGAIEDWVFASGDRIEINKPGFKPWAGTFP